MESSRKAPDTRPPAPAPPSRPRSTARRWRGFIIFFAALAILAVADAFVTEAPGPGYLPAEVEWAVVSADFPGFWRGVEQTPFHREVKAERPYPLHEFELAAYHAAGIRPTSVRWRVWLGEALVMAEAEGATGLSAHPGVLLRAASFVHRMLPTTRIEDSVAEYGPYHYAWRDGFLVASRSRAYVRAALDAPEPSFAHTPQPGQLQVYVGHPEPSAYVALAADAGLPAEGWLTADVEPRGESLEDLLALPTPPIMTLRASHWDNLAALHGAADAIAGEWPPWRFASHTVRGLWDRWALGPLPEDWAGQTGQASLALADVETGEFLPVPVLAGAFQGAPATGETHPLSALAGDEETIPYEWGGAEGEMLPLLGEGLTLCLGRPGDTWLFATQEPLMAALAADSPPGESTEGDIHLTVHWAELNPVLEDFLPLLGEFGLLPGQNHHDVTLDILPYVRAVGRLGPLEMTGEAGDGRLQFSGALFVPADAPDEREGGPS